MTPQLQPQPASQLGLHLTDDLHLTSDQLSDLLVSRTATETEPARLEAAEAHLHGCAACAAEFASLRESLALFQEASVAHADQEFARLKRPAYPVLPAHRPYSQTLFWVAASAILMAGILPLEMRWQRPLATPTAAITEASAHTTESDEALLEDINRELSASVPAPMQALADPTASAAQTSIQTDPQTPSQRKD
jgi:anti-sigma factor RsiW